MTEQNLTDLLERAAERTQVGPPPLERMLARHRHLRRRRTAIVTAAASVAVVAIVGGTAVYSGPGSSPQRDPGPAGTSGAANANEPGPVITTPKGWRAYPQAVVEGELSLESGCLLIGDAVAIWPHGTKWDADARSVTFEDAAVPPPGSAGEVHPPAQLGQHFRGAGGSWEREVLVKSLGQHAVGAVDACLAEGTATRAVFVYPE